MVHTFNEGEELPNGKTKQWVITPNDDEIAEAAARYQRVRANWATLQEIPAMRIKHIQKWRIEVERPVLDWSAALTARLPACVIGQFRYRPRHQLDRARHPLVGRIQARCDQCGQIAERLDAENFIVGKASTQPALQSEGHGHGRDECSPLIEPIAHSPAGLHEPAPTPRTERRERQQIGNALRRLFPAFWAGDEGWVFVLHPGC